jgi:hypothetical protein
VNAGLQCLNFAQPRKKEDAHSLSLDDSLVAFMEKYMQYIAQNILELDIFAHNEASKYCQFCKS